VDLDAKRLELMTEIVPGIRRVVVLVSPFDPHTADMLGRSSLRPARAGSSSTSSRFATRLASTVP
jgi:epoxyqueuosine reductase QueG